MVTLIIITNDRNLSRHANLAIDIVLMVSMIIITRAIPVAELIPAEPEPEEVMAGLVLQMSQKYEDLNNQVDLCVSISSQPQTNSTHPPTHPTDQTNQQTSQLTNQPTNQSTSKLTNQSTNQQTSQPINQPTKYNTIILY